MKFTHNENKQLTEVYRRLHMFHKSNVNDSLIMLAYPSHVKSLVSKGVLKPEGRETPRCLHWYSLTDLSKEMFKSPQKISDNDNLRMFEGGLIIDFNRVDNHISNPYNI